MGSLQVPLDAFRTQHAAVERKLFPRFEADDLVVPDLQLNSSLLSTETAMRLHEPVRLDGRGQASTGHHGPVRTEALCNLQVIDGDARHVTSGVPPPQRALCQSNQGTTTSRANLLVVIDIAGASHLIREPKFTLDALEVTHHRHGGVRLSTAAALRLLSAFTRGLVEDHA